MEENFMELSEIHWENMFYPYICTDSSSLVNVSPWEYRWFTFFYTTCSLNRFIRCYSDISVQTVIIIGTTCILRINLDLNVCLRWI